MTSLLDSEGNIFGKINIIDLLIIIILIFVFVVTVRLFNSYDELKSLDDPSFSNYTSPVVKVPRLKLLLETKLSKEQLKFVNKGEKDLWGGINAVVEDVQEGSDGEVKLILLLEKPVISENNYYLFYSNNQPIIINKPLTVHLRFIDFNAVIKDITLIE